MVCPGACDECQEELEEREEELLVTLHHGGDEAMGVLLVRRVGIAMVIGSEVDEITLGEVV